MRWCALLIGVTVIGGLWLQFATGPATGDAPLKHGSPADAVDRRPASDPSVAEISVAGRAVAAPSVAKPPVAERSSPIATAARTSAADYLDAAISSAPDKTIASSPEATAAEPNPRIATDLKVNPDLETDNNAQVPDSTPTLIAQKAVEPARDGGAAKEPKRKTPKVDPTDEFFNQGVIPEIRITLTQKEEQQLRRDLRRYVDISFTENNQTTYKNVKMKLKGAAGSFRELDDRPALTLSMRKKGERFHGLDKFHLNNSVQDESYLNELIAAQLCREAGVPAARTSHARVWLNGRDLGFYVLKEGMDEEFVKRHFKQHKGNFYEGGFCADIDAPLEKEFGDGPDDRSDVQALIAACREGDQAKRWKLIEEKVAIDEFLKFAAMELMMCHWDGYCQNKNNYRLYFRPTDNKVCFLPHGMDQMFGDVNFSVFHVPGSMVANAVLQNPAVHTQYRQRVRELLPLFAADKLHAKIDAAHARLRPVLAAINEDRARQFDGRVQDFKNRVATRAQAIKAQFPPEPIAFNAEGWSLIEDWAARPQGDAKLELKESDGRKVLSFTPGPNNQTQASFRTKVRLARDRYRFDAKVKTRDVAATPEDKGFGAGLRLSGGTRKNNVIGTTDWQTVSHEFEITQDLQEVELVVELRSTSGSAEFDQASLRIYKIK